MDDLDSRPVRLFFMCMLGMVWVGASNLWELAGHFRRRKATLREKLFFGVFVKTHGREKIHLPEDN